MIYKSLKPYLIFLTTLIILRLRFTFPSLFLYLFVWLAPSFIRLYIQTLPKFETLAKLKSTNNILLIYILVLTYLHFFSAFCSFFVRSLFVLCSFFVRSLFVFCSSFVRLFIICLSCYDCPCGSHCPSCYDLTLYLLSSTISIISIIGIIDIIVLITDIVNISFSSP